LRRSGKILAAAVGVLAAAQMVRFPRVNPPVPAGALAAPPAVEHALRQACYDCHSNETRWPWYSAIAPVSWVIHHDVDEGRRRLNFSSWSDYADDPGTEAHKLEEIARFVTTGDMAPWYYRWLHPDAHLGADERDAVVGWTERTIAALPPSS